MISDSDLQICCDTIPDTTELECDSPAEAMPPQPQSPSGFGELALAECVQQAIQASGYDTPTAIQRQIIPFMLDGRDVLAQSQTGTGKTAAFALPILSRLNVNNRSPQVLVLTPTRELTIQVASSFEKYGSCLDRFSVATIYGGQSYEPQLRQLRQGAQVVVGTPGRVIDHIRRGSLDIKNIDCLVLDEADEMLSRGFWEDVQFILNESSPSRQIALFSATVPPPIKAMAEQCLKDPARITIENRTRTGENIRQRAVILAPRDKVYALCRILESEPTDGVIIFTKTKAATLTVAEELCRRGLAAVALNGDMAQSARERTIEQFKSGQLDLLVATDVAARGLDVSRVSHVINFDPPHDSESYIHRVGRTGRAGRSGEAFLLLTQAQRGKLRLIERATKQAIEIVPVPTAEQINHLRIKRFKEQISEVTAAEDLTMFKKLIADYTEESGKPLELIAAALAHLTQRGRPFLEKDRPKRERSDRSQDPVSDDSRSDRQRRSRFEDKAFDGAGSHSRQDGARRNRTLGPVEPGMTRYRIEVGRDDGVKPGNIVGAIANEAGLEGEFIGPILIQGSYSLVDLPEGMPKHIYQSLRRTWVAGKPLRLSVADETRSDATERRKKFPERGREQPRDGRKPTGKQKKREGTAKPTVDNSKKSKFGKKKKKQNAPVNEQ